MSETKHLSSNVRIKAAEKQHNHHVLAAILG